MEQTIAQAELFEAKPWYHGMKEKYEWNNTKGEYARILVNLLAERLKDRVFFLKMAATHPVLEFRDDLAIRWYQKGTAFRDTRVDALRANELYGYIRIYMLPSTVASWEMLEEVLNKYIVETSK